MNQFLLIIFLCPLLGLTNSSEHTQSYQDHWLHGKNRDYYFYDEMTFGMDLDFLEPCKEMTAQEFRSQLKKAQRQDLIKCTGAWCIEGEFKCKQHDSQTCYNVEHIIDRAGPEISTNREDKDIVANYVMAWGLWNQEIGKFTKTNYSVVKNEKSLIYGSRRISQVRQKIQECIDRKSTKRELTTTEISAYCNSDRACTCDSNNKLDYYCDCDYIEYDCTDTEYYYTNGVSPNYGILYVVIAILSIVASVVIFLAIYLYRRLSKHMINVYDYTESSN